jgi:large subunit ribosomal protein L5
MTMNTDKYTPKLKKQYVEEIVPKMEDKFGYNNVMAVPKLKKIVINMGLNEARENIKAVDLATDELTAIAGQRPLVCRAKKSISNTSDSKTISRISKTMSR